MSYDLTNDAEDPDGPSLPGVSDVVLRRVRNGCIIAVGLLFSFLILWWLRTVYTDLLWYDELGHRDVFTKILAMKLWLFIGGTAVTAAVLVVNFTLPSGSRVALPHFRCPTTQCGCCAPS